MVFRNLRERFGIDDASFLKSLTKCPKKMDSAGRSGAKFYISHDQLYVIKTLTSEEVEQMHHLLKQYHPFIVERHGEEEELRMGLGGITRPLGQTNGAISLWRGGGGKAAHAEKDAELWTSERLLGNNERRKQSHVCI